MKFRNLRIASLTLLLATSYLHAEKYFTQTGVPGKLLGNVEGDYFVTCHKNKMKLSDYKNVVLLDTTVVCSTPTLDHIPVNGDVDAANAARKEEGLRRKESMKIDKLPKNPD